jgi:hypothetical protein
METLAPLAQQLLDNLKIAARTELYTATGSEALDIVNRQLALHISHVNDSCRAIDIELSRLKRAADQLATDLAEGGRPSGTDWVSHYAGKVAEQTARINKEIETFGILAVLRATLMAG